MDPTTPLVLEQASLDDTVHYVLRQHNVPSTMLFCGTKDDFVRQLMPGPTEHQPSNRPTNDEETNVQLSTTGPENSRSWWAVPTLQLLASSRSVRVVFCPDITHLRAYLATYRFKHAARPSEETGSGLLAILNPIHLHRQTSAFSAQGLNRTFSVAVEAAHRSGSKLLIAECTPPIGRRPDADTGIETMPGQDSPDAQSESAAALDPWEEEVSILNVTTKSFGAGERGWVGRTVKLRAIAARWCTFEDLREPAR